MSFWDDFEDIGVSLIAKLNDENVSLSSIIEDPDCLTVLRDEKEELIQYLSKPEIFRELYHAALPTDIDPTLDETEQYKYPYQCYEVLYHSNAKLNRIFVADEELMNFLVNFLVEHGSNINHLTISLYAKLLQNLYAIDNQRVLDCLQKSQFIESALPLLKYSAIYELLYNLATTIPPDLRNGIKKYFIDRNFGGMLLETFKSTTDLIMLENIATLWAEFIKNMRDFCYNFETTDDFLLHIQDPELLIQLMAHLFPEDKTQRDPAKIFSGCWILLSHLEHTFDIGQPSMDMTRTEGHPKGFNPDPEFHAENICSKYIAELLDVMLESAKEGDGDVMYRCGLVLEAIFNTSHSKNHAEFVEQLKKANFGQFFFFLRDHPTITLLSNSIYNIVCFILYCSLGEEDHLVAYIINDLGLLSIIVDALRDIPENDLSVAFYGCRSFFYRLAERIVAAKGQSQNSARITKRISELPDSTQWDLFADSKLKDYLREHLSCDLSTTNCDHSMSDLSTDLNITVDELMDIGPNELDPVPQRSPTSQIIEGLERLNEGTNEVSSPPS